MNDEHFIRNIEIKNYKLFKDFKAEGFGRVNLIGGKNNVGKTAFMEACCINVYGSSFKRLIEILIHIKHTREKINLLFNDVNFDKKKFIELSNNIFVKSNKNTIAFKLEEKNLVQEYILDIGNQNIRIRRDNIDIIGREEVLNIRFVDNFGLSNNEIKVAYSAMQRLDIENELNIILNDFDSRIESFKIIDEKPQCKVQGKYFDITELGDGTKHLITIITTLYKCTNGYLFIDEIDNGIHYTQLDKLWEIILTISKEQNVQVFATTHSKECIESYARVAKRLEDEEITFVELGKNKDNEIKAMVYPYEWFIDEIEQNHEVRGW